MDIEYIKQVIENREISTIGKCKFFSVLIPLIEIEEEIYILYQIRADNLKRQPGEIGFPGGHIERGETPRQAAIRETCEEMNVREEDIEIIGEFDTLYGSTAYVMYPFVGIISYEAYKSMEPSEDEVKSTFLVPLNEFLLKNKPDVQKFQVQSKPDSNFDYKKYNINHGYSWGTSNVEIPLYDYDGKIIWGITGRITYELIKVLTGEKE